jgi:hypothetical protein
VPVFVTVSGQLSPAAGCGRDHDGA